MVFVYEIVSNKKNEKVMGLLTILGTCQGNQYGGIEDKVELFYVAQVDQKKRKNFADMPNRSYRNFFLFNSQSGVSEIHGIDTKNVFNDIKPKVVASGKSSVFAPNITQASNISPILKLHHITTPQ